MSDKEPAHNLIAAIRWQNIKRIAEELEIAAAEVGSPGWVEQARILKTRVGFELDLLKGLDME